MLHGVKTANAKEGGSVTRHKKSDAIHDFSVKFSQDTYSNRQPVKKSVFD